MAADSMVHERPFVEGAKISDELRTETVGMDTFVQFICIN